MESILRRVQLAQLDTLIEVKRICNKYNIKYFLVGGTLLGAVRHSGFIPWDDDLDIGMRRDEYEKFIEVAMNELDEKFFLQNWNTDENFALPITKIRINNTRYIEKNSRNVKLHNGIYIDIFPFDNIPDNNYLKFYQNVKTYVLKMILLCNRDYILYNDDEKLKKYIYYFIKKISKIINKNKIIKALDKEMKKYNRFNTCDIVTFGGAYGYKKESIHRIWTENLKDISFEGNVFKCFDDTNKYLTHLYGDYMKFPPKEKRYNRHGIIEIDLNNII